MNERIEIRAEGSAMMQGVPIYIFDHGNHGIGRLTFEEYSDGSHVDHTVCLDYDAAQQLMDDLWRAGIRPTEGHGSAGAMRRIEDHLKREMKLSDYFRELVGIQCNLEALREKSRGQ